MNKYQIALAVGWVVSTVGAMLYAFWTADRDEPDDPLNAPIIDDPEAVRFPEFIDE